MQLPEPEPEPAPKPEGTETIDEPHLPTFAGTEKRSLDSLYKRGHKCLFFVVLVFVCLFA